MTVTARRRTQAERKAESDASILSAAIELFAERGYVRTTLNDIGARAGYTGGLISNRFGSKTELLRAVLDSIHSSFARETLTRLDGVELVFERLQIYVDVFLRRVTEPRSDVRALYVVMGEALGAVPEVREEVASFTDHTVHALARLIREGVDNGELHADLEPKAAAMLLLATMRGLMLQHMARPRSVVVRNVRSEIGRFLASWRRGGSA